MIDFKRVRAYCKDDMCLIENYEKAANDKTQTWHCHHRLETDKNMNQQELKESGLYLHRPASELIFLTHAEHSKLHNTGDRNSMYGKRGKDNPNYGSKRSLETKQKQSVARKRYFNDPENRKKHGNIRRNAVLTEDHKQLLSDINKGARFMSNGIERHYVLKDKIEYYLNLGYHFGMK